MSNDSISPWWEEGWTRLKPKALPRTVVDPLIDKLEEYSGRTVADRDAYHRSLEGAVSAYRMSNKDYDQRPSPTQVEKEYQELLKSIENVRHRLNRIVLSVPFSRPLQQAAARRVGYDLRLVPCAGQYGAGLAHRQLADLCGLFQAALAEASFDADQHPRRGALSKIAQRYLAGDVADLYEAAVRLRAGGSGTETSVASPFLRHFNDVWAIAEPDKPPVTARTVLRYVEKCRQEDEYWKRLEVT